MKTHNAHMVRFMVLISGLIALLSYHLNAQISPGDLTSVHAHLEGISNCTKCHDLGDKVSNEKCLECHKEIKGRLVQKKGYHASAPVKGKDCFTCHSEHHGRNFEIVRFDTEKFDHQLTGYPLTGAHQKTDCKACHIDDKIESVDLKKKKFTYLGLKTECVACHKDVHQNSLGNNCASCHNTEVFKPAVFFDHAKTEFPLKGKHKTVDCRSCHEVVVSNNELLQKFYGVPFNSCAECHDDVHNNKFGRNCKECHTEESFNVFVGKSTFNHNQTEFPLVGKHRNVNCASCHQMAAGVNAENVFQDYRGKAIQNCTTCHKDVHDGRFGTDCRQCHSEESFRKIRNLEKFDHALTGYQLEGRHVAVDCRKCHETNLTDALPHNRCADCHDDFHKGQFVQANIMPDCRECHTVEGFKGSLYSIDKHNESSFPLTGAHLATPCIDCHFKKNEWSFKNIGAKCIDCHADIHKGFLSEQYYPANSCNECHSTETWASVEFEHVATGFALHGKHQRISCTDCHRPDTIAQNEIVIPFSGLETTCTTCHENIHGNQFEIEGNTDCMRCHGFEVWAPSTFDHNKARFALDGAHNKVACTKCHMEEQSADGSMRILYRTDKLECMDCHL